MEFKQYPSYKPSGVEWLGDVPEHWIVCLFKRQIVRNDGGVWGEEPTGHNDTIVFRSTEQTMDGRWNIVNPALRNLSDKEKKSALLEEGDLLLTKSSGSSLHIGKTTLVDVEIAKNRCCYSNFMQRIRTTKTYNSTLGWYVLNNQLTREQFSVFSTSTTGLANLNSEIIGNIHIVVPPVNEQLKVIEYLDTETTRIDNLIAKQEKLIELLEEQRKSIISHAVTKGLNPNAPMKDSGVEWLGEVPEHWEIYPIGYSFDLLKNNNVGDDWEHTQLLSLTLQGVIKKDINEAKGKTHSDYSTYQKVNVGDFIFCLFDIEETPRTVGVVETSGMITSAYTALKPKPFINPKYFYYFFECRDDLKAFGSEYSGLRKTIRPTKFIKLKICYPKLNEQCEIVGFLDTKCKKIDLLISKQQQLIKKLKEYRISIISHAVTGKIDVREFGA